MPNIFINDLVIKLPSEVHNTINPRFAFNSLLCVNEVMSQNKSDHPLITLRELEGGAILMPFDELGNIAVTPNHRYTLVEIEANTEHGERSTKFEVNKEKSYVSNRVIESKNNVIANNANDNSNNSKNNEKSNVNKRKQELHKEKLLEVSDATKLTNKAELQPKGKRQRDGEVVNNNNHESLQKDFVEQSGKSAQIVRRKENNLIRMKNKFDNERSELVFNNEFSDTCEQTDNVNYEINPTKIQPVIKNKEQALELQHLKSTNNVNNHETTKKANYKNKNLHEEQLLENIDSPKNDETASMINTITSKKGKKIVTSVSSSHSSNNDDKHDDDIPLTALFHTVTTSLNQNELAKEVDKNRILRTATSSTKVRPKKTTNVKALEKDKSSESVHKSVHHEPDLNLSKLDEPVIDEMHELSQNQTVEPQKLVSRVMKQINAKVAVEKNKITVNNTESESVAKEANKDQIVEETLFQMFSQDNDKEEIGNKHINSIQSSAAASPFIHHLKSSSPSAKHEAHNISSSRSPDAAAVNVVTTPVMRWKKYVDNDDNPHSHHKYKRHSKQTLSNLDVSSDSEEN